MPQAGDRGAVSSRAMRREGTAGVFEMVRAEADPLLAPFILGYAGFREAIAGSGEHLEPPTPKTVLIVNFGAPFEIDYPDDRESGGPGCRGERLDRAGAGGGDAGRQRQSGGCLEAAGAGETLSPKANRPGLPPQTRPVATRRLVIHRRLVSAA